MPAFLPKVGATRSNLADYYCEVQRRDSDVSRAIELLLETEDPRFTDAPVPLDEAATYAKLA